LDNPYLKWSAAACMFFFALCMLLVALNLWPAYLIALFIVGGLFLIVALVLIGYNRRWRNTHPSH